MRAFIVFCTLPLAVLAAQTAEPTRDRPHPSEQSEPSPLPSVSVEQAIQSAVAAMDRLNTLQDGDPAPEVLPSIQQALDLLSTKDANNPWQLFFSARVMEISGRKTEGIDRLRKFLETPEGRNEWRVHRLLGDLFVEEFPRLAKASYEKALALNPREPNVLAGLSLSASKLGDAEGALQYAREAVAANGRRTIRFLAFEARLLASQKRWSEALLEATAGLALADGASRTDPASRARLNVLNSQYGLVTEILQSLIREKGTDIADDGLRLAAYMREQADVQGRLALHQIAGVLNYTLEKSEPNPPLKLLEQYASLLTELERNEDAIAQWERVLRLDPQHATAQEWLTRLKGHSPPTGE